MVILGWMIQKPLSLLLDPFQSVVSDTLIFLIDEHRLSSLKGSLSLRYDSPSQRTACFLIIPINAVQIMSYVVADGKSNWLEGVILICEYHWQLFIP